MRYLSKKAVLLYLIIIAYLVGRVFLVKYISIAKYCDFINPLFWIFVAIVSYLLTRDEPTPKMRSKLDIIQSVVIILIIYVMIYFPLGLVFGYERSPYSHTLISILKNMWAFVSIIIFQEMARFALIRLSPKKIGYYAIITILLIITQVEFWSIGGSLGNNVDFFKYTSQTIIPLIVSNCLFTYLTITSGNISSTVYRSILELLVILLPIFPSINWLISSMMNIILVIIVALYVNYTDMKSSRTYSRKQVKKESIVSYIPFVIVLVLVVCFVSGMFKYIPIAVLSDSMLPEFSRGDAVIIEKISDKSLKKLKKGTIIYYSKDSKLVIHRIVEITKDESNKTKIITKGDNNNTVDPSPVSEGEVLGVAKFMVPYVGYPSVLVSEFLKK